MLKIGDKIKMTKAIGKYDMVGKVFEITDIPNDDTEYYEILNSYIGYGYMKEDEFNANFEKIDTKKEWTDWIKTKSGFSYRTDNKKYVKVRKGEYEVKSSCHPCDTFSLAKGIAVCLQKIKDKEKQVVNVPCTISDMYDMYNDFNNIKSDIEYNAAGDSIDIIFDSNFKEFSWAHYVAPGIYLKMRIGTNSVVGIHIDNFNKKLKDGTVVGD